MHVHGCSGMPLTTYSGSSDRDRELNQRAGFMPSIRHMTSPYARNFRSSTPRLLLQLIRALLRASDLYLVERPLERCGRAARGDRKEGVVASRQSVQRVRWPYGWATESRPTFESTERLRAQSARDHRRQAREQTVVCEPDRHPEAKAFHSSG
jgi:hypothetical protein